MIGKVRVRGVFNWGHLSSKVEEGRRRGLRQAGAIVYRRSQSEILLKSRSGAYSAESDESINYQGIAYKVRRWTGKKINPTRLSTYKSSRFPKGFIDRKSVV